MAQRESIFIGDKEYAASKIAAFAANGIILKLQKLILPVIGELAGDGGKQVNLMDMDVRAAFNVISERLDESVMTDIVLPMFKLSQVASVTDNCKIDSAQSIDKVFQDSDGLADFYELIFEVMRFNFSGFFGSLAARFGNSGGVRQVTASTTAESVS